MLDGRCKMTRAKAEKADPTKRANGGRQRWPKTRKRNKTFNDYAKDAGLGWKDRDSSSNRNKNNSRFKPIKRKRCRTSLALDQEKMKRNKDTRRRKERWRRDAQGWTGASRDKIREQGKRSAKDITGSSYTSSQTCTQVAAHTESKEIDEVLFAATTISSSGIFNITCHYLPSF